MKHRLHEIGGFLDADEFSSNQDSATVSELDRVSQEVDENLPQMRRICTHPRQRCPNGQREAEPFFSNQRLYLTRDVKHERSELERLGVNFQASGSHLREIQNLVNEVPKMIRGCLNAFDRTYLT